MSFKSLTSLHLSAALLAGVLFLGDAAASTPQARRLVRQISVEASQVYRTADLHARRFSPREDQALRDLRDVQDYSRDLEMDIDSARPMRVQMSLEQLERATQRASGSIIQLSAYRLIDQQFRRIERDVQDLRRELRQGGGGHGPGPLPRIAPIARQYKEQIQNVLFEIRSSVGNPQGHPRVRMALQSLRQLKMEADTFHQLARAAVRPMRVKRAFEQLAQTHRDTRMQVTEILRRTGAGASMRLASQLLREMGQQLDRVGPGHGHFDGGFDGGFQDDFGTFPRH